MKGLVTGATGAVGPALVEALLSSGWQVRALVRRGSAAQVPGEVEVITGDICAREAVIRAVDGVDVVFHLAALLHRASPGPELVQRYHDVNVEGTRNLVEAAKAAGARRVVFFSTIAVYGPPAVSPLHESQACRPDTDYGRSKLAAERLVLEASSENGAPLGVVLRLAAVYGPGVKGNYERLVRALARGWFVSVGAAANRRALVYDTDVARAAVLAASHPAAAGRIYNVADGVSHTLREIIAAISEALPRRPRVWSVPAAPARWLAGLVEEGASLLNVCPPVRRVMVAKYLEDIVVDASAIQAELGFVPQVGLRTGWQTAVASLRQRTTRGRDVAG